MPRETLSQLDLIFGEDPTSAFERAYQFEMYIPGVNEFGGDQDFFSKFGIELRDDSSFLVAKNTFRRWVPESVTNKPREGDLIFVPLWKKIFEIKFVEQDLLFFTAGKRDTYLYEMKCESYRYSNQKIETGVDEIDEIENMLAFTTRLTLGSGSGNFYIGEAAYAGTSYDNANAVFEISHWYSNTGTLDIINIAGPVSNVDNVVGVTSGAEYVISDVDDMGNFIEHDNKDNLEIQTQADVIMNFDENNPFGQP